MTKCPQCGCSFHRCEVGETHIVNDGAAVWQVAGQILIVLRPASKQTIECARQLLDVAAAHSGWPDEDAVAAFVAGLRASQVAVKQESEERR